jgi:hypothetical protein
VLFFRYLFQIQKNKINKIKMKNLSSQLNETETAMSKNKGNQTFKEALDVFYKYKLSYSSEWMMPKDEVRNTRTCMLLSNSKFNVLAYMSREGDKNRAILISSDGVYRINDHFSGKLPILTIRTIFE